MHLIRQHRLEMELAYLGVDDVEFVTLSLVGEQTKRKFQKEESDELGISRRRRATTDEHLTHRPPICCAFCCCVRLELCQGVCRVACGVCQHPLFVALFRDATDPRFGWISLFKIVGIVLSAINIVTNFASNNFGVKVAFFFSVRYHDLFLTKHDLLKEALVEQVVRTRHCSIVPVRYVRISVGPAVCWLKALHIFCLVFYICCAVVVTEVMWRRRSWKHVSCPCRLRMNSWMTRRRRKTRRRRRKIWRISWAKRISRRVISIDWV